MRNAESIGLFKATCRARRVSPIITCVGLVMMVGLLLLSCCTVWFILTTTLLREHESAFNVRWSFISLRVLRADHSWFLLPSFLLYARLLMISSTITTLINVIIVIKSILSLEFNAIYHALAAFYETPTWYYLLLLTLPAVSQLYQTSVICRVKLTLFGIIRTERVDLIVIMLYEIGQATLIVGCWDCL